MNGSARASLAVSFALLGLPAWAQPAPAGAPASRLAEARERTERAMQAFRARDYRGAIHEFELANAAAASPELWFNIGRAHELLGEHALAIENFRRYLRDKVDPPDRAEVEARIRELERLAEQQRTARRRLSSGATLRFEVPVAGARIFVDEVAAGAAPTAATLTVAPGAHAVRVEASGMQPWRAAVRVREGDALTVYATPVASTRYRTVARGHLASFLVGGLSLAALGTAAVSGAQALAADEPARTERADRADAFLGVSAGLALAAVVLYFVERGHGRTEQVHGGSGRPGQ